MDINTVTNISAHKGLQLKKGCPFCKSTKLTLKYKATALEIGTTRMIGWISCKNCGAQGPNITLCGADPLGSLEIMLVEKWENRI